MEPIHIVYQFETPNKLEFRQFHTYDQTILPEMGSEITFEKDVAPVYDAYGTGGPFIVDSRSYAVNQKQITTAILYLRLKHV